jgi:hypothetical protein
MVLLFHRVHKDFAMVLPFHSLGSSALTNGTSVSFGSMLLTSSALTNGTSVSFGSMLLSSSVMMNGTSVSFCSMLLSSSALKNGTSVSLGIKGRLALISHFSGSESSALNSAKQALIRFCCKIA